MDKQQHMLTKQNLKSLKKDKRFYNRNILTGSIVAIFIASTPFLFYLYENVPEEKVWNTFLFTYESKFYEDASIGVWILMMKLIPLSLLIVWFFTCKHWWYHAILVPIAMFIFQTFSALNEENQFMDELHIIYLLPVMAIIIPSIYLIRAKMFNRINDADKSMTELEQEFMMKPKGVWGKVKQYF